MHAIICTGLIAALAGCSRASGEYEAAGIAFPTDAQISTALQTQFASDANSGAARELIRTLGGDKGELRYQVRQVIYRQGAFEARYDAVLRLGQPGAQSLQALYATMIPDAERTRLPAQDLAAYEGWFKQQAAQLEKTAPDQARALLQTVEMLGTCYRDAPTGAEVVVMQGLAALLSPERQGLFAEKLASDRAVARCLPA